MPEVTKTMEEECPHCGQVLRSPKRWMHPIPGVPGSGVFLHADGKIFCAKMWAPRRDIRRAAEGA